MDIVITLPLNLIYRIKCGIKLVEVRKSFPKKFNMLEDNVFVVEKKTTNVIMSFTLRRYKVVSSPSEAWDLCGYRMGIPFEWLIDYAQSEKDLFLWYIDKVHVFAKPFKLEDTFGIKRAPQSFCYVRKLQ